MTDQSTAAAERSAHVTRQPRAQVVTWPVVETAPGAWKLRAVVDAERAGYAEGMAAAATVARATAARIRARAHGCHVAASNASTLEMHADALAEMQRRAEPTGLEERGA